MEKIVNATESLNPREKRINDPSLKLNCFAAKKVCQLPPNHQYIDTSITFAHNKACKGRRGRVQIGSETLYRMHEMTSETEKVVLYQLYLPAFSTDASC